MPTMRQAIKDIADAIRSKGVSGTMSLQEMPTKVSTIGKKYGVSIDSMLGDVDANGALQYPSVQSDLYAPEIEELDYNTFASMIGRNIRKILLPNLAQIQDNTFNQFFDGMTSLTEFSAPSIQSAGQFTLSYAFQNCPNLVSIDLSGLTTIGNSGMSYFARYCPMLTNVDLRSLTTIGNSGLTYAFTECTSLTRIDYTNNSSVKLDSLTTLASSGLSYAFQNCTGLNYVDLSRIADANYSTVFSNAFNGCTSLVEVRLPEITAVKTQAFSNTFSGCTSLRKVYLSKLSSAGLRCWQNTFANCASLELVDFSEATAVPAGNVGATTFTNAPSTFKIVVPDALYSNWIAATGWSGAGVVEHIVKSSEYTEEE